MGLEVLFNVRIVIFHLWAQIITGLLQLQKVIPYRHNILGALYAEWGTSFEIDKLERVY